MMEAFASINAVLMTDLSCVSKATLFRLGGRAEQQD